MNVGNPLQIEGTHTMQMYLYASPLYCLLIPFFIHLFPFSIHTYIHTCMGLPVSRTGLSISRENNILGSIILVCESVSKNNIILYMRCKHTLKFAKSRNYHLCVGSTNKNDVLLNNKKKTLQLVKMSFLYSRNMLLQSKIVLFT